MLDQVKTSIQAQNLIPKCNQPNCDCNISEITITKTCAETNAEVRRTYNLNKFEIDVLIVCAIYAIEVLKIKPVVKFMNSRFSKPQQQALINKIVHYAPVDTFHTDIAFLMCNDNKKLLTMLITQFIINVNNDVFSAITIV
jgi:hypothetical protein